MAARDRSLRQGSISVDSATDVAKDAADVLPLEKDLNVLADGVVGGRRIFANTMKYVLMGTSSQLAIPTDNVDPEQVARPTRVHRRAGLGVALRVAAGLDQTRGPAEGTR